MLWLTGGIETRTSLLRFDHFFAPYFFSNSMISVRSLSLIICRGVLLPSPTFRLTSAPLAISNSAISPLIGLHRYIRENEQEMRYDVFRAKGYEIGSGAVEGACKCVVGKRLKQSGMIWNRTGSSAILVLRIGWPNEEWKQFWKNKPLAA